MIVEIDQSGKLEQLDTTTVIAFSNSKSGAIIISVTSKRKIIQYLRKTLILSKNIIPVLFAVIIFILSGSLSPSIVLRIDEEYTGKESQIKEILEKLFRKKYSNRWQGSIRFAKIGRSSNAHNLAWGIHRGKIKGNFRKIKESEILSYF